MKTCSRADVYFLATHFDFVVKCAHWCKDRIRALITTNKQMKDWFSWRDIGRSLLSLRVTFFHCPSSVILSSNIKGVGWGKHFIIKFNLDALHLHLHLIYFGKLGGITLELFVARVLLLSVSVSCILRSCTI